MDFILLERLADVWAVFLHHPKAYFPIIGEWFLTVLYTMISGDHESHAEIYATGVTLGFVGFELLPFENPTEMTFANPIIYVSIVLMVYAVFLIIIAAKEMMPDFLTHIFGSPGALAIPTILALIFFQSEVPIDMMTILIIAVPIAVVEIIKEVRQHVFGH